MPITSTTCLATRTWYVAIAWIHIQHTPNDPSTIFLGFPTAPKSLPPLSEDNSSSIAPMTPPLTPLCSNVEYSSHCLPTTTRDSTVDTMSCGRTIVDMPPTPKSIHAFDLDLSWHSEIQLQNVDACKKRRL